MAEYLLQGLMSFGSWEAGVLKRLPVPSAPPRKKTIVGALAASLHDAKADWDEGNETSHTISRSLGFSARIWLAPMLRSLRRLKRLADVRSWGASAHPELYTSS